MNIRLFHLKIFTAHAVASLFFFTAPGSAFTQVPSPERSGPYTLRWSTESYTFGAAVIVAFTASAVDDSLPILSTAEIAALDKNDINPVDRITAGIFSPVQSSVSDVLVGGAILSPLLFVFDDKIRRDAGTIGTMYLQTVLFSTFTPSFGKGSVRRVRPYVYSSSASLSEKQDIEAQRSFFSGHATWAFSTCVFFASVYSDYYPDSEWKDDVWMGAIGLASSVAILRVTSGAHFLSDIAVGAAVGSAIGYGIPYIHKHSTDGLSFTPVIAPDYRGMSLTLRLP